MKAILLIMIIFSAKTYAVDLELGCGFTKYAKPPNGRWFQSEFEHDIDLTANSCHVAAVFEYSETIDFRLGYIDLGNMGITAVASASDELYDDWKAGKDEIGELSNWYSKGKTHGLFATIDYKFAWFTVRAGLFYHKTEFTVDVPDWRWIRHIDGAYDFSEIMPITVHAKERFQAGYVLGVAKEVNNFVVSAEVYETKGGSVYIPGNLGNTLNVSLSYRF